MYRTILYLSLFLFIICGAGLLIPRSVSYMTVFLPYSGWAFLGLLLSPLLVHFAIFSHFRTNMFYRLLFAVLGVGLVGIAVIGIIYPNFFGLLQNDVNPTNLLIVMVGGIACMIGALERDRPTVSKQIIPAFQVYVHEQNYPAQPAVYTQPLRSSKT